MMELRPYFLFGDLLASAFNGALVGLIVAALIGPSWNMLIAMVVGMGLGMVIALPGSFLFTPFFGAMEVMIPVMVTGMSAGMVVGMGAAMSELPLSEAAFWGAGVGVGVVMVIWVVNARLTSQER